MTTPTDALITRIHRELDAGLLPSCQVAWARNGEIEHFATYGDATDDTDYVIFSATKAIVASLVWVLMGEGLIDVHRLVVDYIPEFGTHRKDIVTVEQVMLHTSGFPHAPMGPRQWSTREGRVAQMANWRLNWEPDTAYEYHPSSAHWVLAEIIDRVTGGDFRDLVEERITRPAGITRRVLGVPADEPRTVAFMTSVGAPATPDELEAVLGVRELPVTEVTQEALLMFNDPAVREVGSPGAAGTMTAAELALFYQALLHNPAGVWKPEILADGTGRVRNRKPDRWTRVPANRSLGLIIAGDDGKANVRGFGHTGSRHTFGHNGAGGQVAWADPESGLSFVYLTNGLDEHVLRQGRRSISISSHAAVV